jgi:hypothetical protein
VNNTYQLADGLTIRSGNHNYNLGFDVRRTELNSDLPRNARPLVSFNGAPRLVFENGAFRFPASSDLNQFIRPEDLVALGAASNFYLTLNSAGNDAIAGLRFHQLNFFGQYLILIVIISPHELALLTRRIHSAEIALRCYAPGMVFSTIKS